MEYATVTKTCSCGARFQLHVELAVHRLNTGHIDTECAPAEPPPISCPEPVPQGTSRSWHKTLLAGVVLLSILGFTAGLNLTVKNYTSWQCTANVLMLP